MIEPITWDDDWELEMHLDITAPRATLLLHINRELIHHGAEIALLRDLYAHRPLTP